MAQSIGNNKSDSGVYHVAEVSKLDMKIEDGRVVAYRALVPVSLDK